MKNFACFLMCRIRAALLKKNTSRCLWPVAYGDRWDENLNTSFDDAEVSQCHYTDPNLPFANPMSNLCEDKQLAVSICFGKRTSCI